MGFEADANLPSCPSEEGKKAQGGGDNGELSRGSLPRERHGRSPGKQSKRKRQCRENCYKLKLCNYYEGCRCGGGKCISLAYRNCFNDQSCQKNVKACTPQNPCVCVDKRRDPLGYRRFRKGVKKSPDYYEYPDYPVPDYECQRNLDDYKGCHPPCSVRGDHKFCDIFDYEVVIEPSNNQTQN